MAKVGGHVGPLKQLISEVHTLYLSPSLVVSWLVIKVAKAAVRGSSSSCLARLRRARRVGCLQPPGGCLEGREAAKVAALGLMVR